LSVVKSQILEQLKKNYPKFPKKNLEKALDLVFDEIISGLSKGNNVEIRGFGSFKIKKSKSREGRNPKNGIKINIPEKNKVQWKMSKDFLKKINLGFNNEK
jgi:integration host factor subunit beta